MKKISTFALGLIVGATLTAGSVVGASNSLSAIQKSVKLVVDGKSTTVSAMNVNNKLYVPVRDAGNSFGYSVTGVTSSTVTFKEGTTATSSVSNGTNIGSKTASSTGGRYVEGLHDKYSTNGKLDADKIKVGIEAGEITVNAQDKETGNSILHYVVLEDNFAVYQVIKVTGLNVNLQNKDGKTPLMLSVVYENDFYFGEILDELKADTTIKDKNSKTALDYAKKNSSYYNALFIYTIK
ncbi:hypothetical protein SAMN04487895_10374 [Paenibacillus sophorae]|uniref:Ankyrin repeat domain-containing protein n=1 Tax=Paenibacillus sophorae TaxID=1333845 RepID=A0A1H8JM96_9BACL|nr:ankyrin repeat domain-containing protein [Paenibacillus sophorae]QWU13408.1 ankyrin repeat domain-containing protein [Paenibacillus sophorae]SEN81681.1 hypothetical protein SAMN04487895_10374 [Paenibacillus sophorae]